MRYVVACLSVAAVAVMAVSTVSGQGSQQIFLTNRNSDPKWSMLTPKPDGVLWNSPTATKGGALWLMSGGAPVLLAGQDVNLQFRVQAPEPYGWTIVATALTSAPHAQLPSADNGYVGSAYLDVTAFNEPGMYQVIYGNSPGIPGTNNVSGPNSMFQMELYAWLGNYDSVAAAVAAGSPVGCSGTFSQFVGYGSPPPIPQQLDSMPATILRTTLPGDANIDGKVDINDLSKVLANYDKTIAMDWSTGDFNSDGRVDINDLSVVLTNYDHSAAGSVAGGISTVPEPGTVALLAAGLASLLSYARRKPY